MSQHFNRIDIKAFVGIAKQFENEQVIKSFFPSLDEIIENLHDYGEGFCNRLKHFAKTEKNEPIVLENWTREYASLIGDLRISHVITAGNAQIGKSLFNMLLLVDFLVYTNLNALWFYPTKQQVDSLVPEVFSKCVQYYVENLELEILQRTGESISLIKPTDRQLASRYQVNGATAIFSYASTSGRSETSTTTGLSTAKAGASSFSGSILFIDESSQISREQIWVLLRRIDAGRIPTQPVREIGTFGSGLGIEVSIESSDYHFYPHICCDSCGETIPLSPKGCLLQEDENGNFLSATGRPKSWFFKDFDNKVDSAYIGCSFCGEEITKEKRIKESFFQCLKTDIKLKDYLNSLPKNTEDLYKRRKDSVSLHLSPLLRDTAFNLAAKLIDIGLNTESTRDYQQQVLGYSSESDTSKVTPELIKAANWKVLSKTQTNFVLCGVDQGRQEDFITVVRYWVNEDYKLSSIQQIEESEREIIISKPINRSEIKDIYQKYNIRYGFIDNEPDRKSAYELAQQIKLVPVDQRKKVNKLLQEIEVSTGGMNLSALAMDNAYFQDMALNGFLQNKVKTSDWNISDRSIHSPVRHFLSVARDKDETWQRAKDKIDDLWFSYVFCEACFYYVFQQQLNNQSHAYDDSWYQDFY
ncbi:MAG: hypothetical protein AAF316_00080 [Cyanobacteria bacterium P01_A01_bin.80]